MGERGVLSRLLAPKFGAFLTFGALSKGRESAPGQPPLEDMRQRYRLQRQHAGTQVWLCRAGRGVSDRGCTGPRRGRPARPGRLWLQPARPCAASVQVYGIIGNPVAHSRSPIIHNAAFQDAGVDAVYVPLLVDDLQTLLASPGAQALSGFSVTIPHKVSACSAAAQQ